MTWDDSSPLRRTTSRRARFRPCLWENLRRLTPAENRRLAYPDAMDVIRQIVTDLSNTYGDGNGRDYITIHETANTNNGADAEAHADLQSAGNSRDASWHYQVDDHVAYQSFEDVIQCWHAGDGQGTGNLHSIAIEICVNKDGNFTQAVSNAAELTADLMAKYGIPIGNVVQHNRWSGKNCPTYLRTGAKGIDWADFIEMVKKGGGEVIPNPPTGNIAVDGYWGNETTYALQKSLGTPEDGIVSAQNVYYKDDNPGLKNGWQWTSNPDLYNSGSLVIARMQDLLNKKGGYGIEEDGSIGPETIKALQKRLKSLGIYDGTIDGELWENSPTIKAMQRRLNYLLTL